LIVGPKGLKQGEVEVKDRKTGARETLSRIGLTVSKSGTGFTITATISGLLPVLAMNGQSGRHGMWRRINSKKC